MESELPARPTMRFLSQGKIENDFFSKKQKKRDIHDYCVRKGLPSLAQGMIELPPPQLLRDIAAKYLLSENGSFFFFSCVLVFSFKKHSKSEKKYPSKAQIFFIFLLFKGSKGFRVRAGNAILFAVHTYRNRWGESDYRNAVRALLKEQNGVDVPVDAILGTQGVTSGIVGDFFWAGGAYAQLRYL